MPPAVVFDILSGSEWEGRAEFPPGPQLACALAGQRLSELSDVELTELMAAAHRQTSWAQALELSAVAELSRRRHHDDHGPAAAGHWTSEVHEIVTEEVSLAITVTGTAASALVVLAEQLAEQLPRTHAALEKGRIDLPRAKVIADALRGVDDALARSVEAAVIDEAAAMTTAKLRHRVKRAIKAADPDAAEQRTKAAVKDRRLELFDNSSGTGDLALRDLPAEDAHAIYNRINAAAQALKADGDERPIDILRADLTHALLRGLPLPEAVRHLLIDPAGDLDPDRSRPADPRDDGTAHHAGTHSQREAAEQAPADSAAAIERWIDDALSQSIDWYLKWLLDRARTDGRLDGLDLLIAQAVQAMHDGLSEIREAWCRTTGPGPGEHGHKGYRPPAGMRRLIERRHATCVFPTCNRQAGRCDIDHTIPWHKGGLTCRCNLSPLCRRHHRLK
ncbi:HNH endonuclease signature motif containing protein, partial [Actinomadura alba]